MERLFDEELKQLNEKILYMGSIAEKMIHNALTGLKKRDEAVLKEVFDLEKKINGLHLEIDELCIKLIALRQPLAVDLRFITAAMKINSELERIGDQAVNIAQNTLVFIEQHGKNVLEKIDNMAEIIKIMVKEALDAFVKRDPEMAKNIFFKDDEVDKLKRQSFDELIENVKKNGISQIDHAFDLILISRNMEKIADHAANICEDVIFMVLGKDIRHHNLSINNK